MSQLADIRPVRQKQKRFESPKYLKWVREQPCVISHREGCDAHHIIGVGDGVMGSKASDLMAFPLKRDMHDHLHADVREFEALYGSQWKFVALTLARYVMERLK